MTIIKILHFPWIEQIISSHKFGYTKLQMPHSIIYGICSKLRKNLSMHANHPLPINPEKRESPYFCEVVGANHWGRKTKRGGDGATGARGSDGDGARGVRGNERLSETAMEQESESERETETERRVRVRERLRVRGNESERLCFLKLSVFES